jgi:hypothetical protein
MLQDTYPVGKALWSMNDRYSLCIDFLSQIIRDVRAEHHELMSVSTTLTPSDAIVTPRTCGCGPGFAAVGCANASSLISSSISVAAVPFDVTGDGPTMSLGLMRLWFAGTRWTELGRKLWESTELADDDLHG